MIIIAFISLRNIRWFTKRLWEEVISDLNLSEELPFQQDSHVKKFEITYRNTESIEDVETVLACLDKDAWLLDLIPIAFKSYNLIVWDLF